ncbi:MAG: TetR/AcrR family transcriptional regulator, fatty acid metabolism regulator protein [Clostridia bacterium]|jgi:AcrR family transcriptional regulator|nr:TetR family transcriptional regulator [Clostridiales bacterium]MDK2985383.1 TetR/AcrR family transcriptional regulator, fatty acid metabolism regulator protein [Clostridia bacterium]
MVYKKTQKVREKLQNKKEKIIKAAKDILAEKSYGEISIKAIAKKAGIATGTFYLYFSNKEALIDSIVEEMYQELLAVIKSERSKYDCVFDKLQASMEACLKLFIKEENLAKILLVKLPGINNAFNKKLAEIEKELIKLTKKDLDDLKTQGLLPEQDTLVSATAFVGTFRQVLISWLKEGEPQDLQSAFKTLMKYNLRGLGKNV